MHTKSIRFLFAAALLFCTLVSCGKSEEQAVKAAPGIKGEDKLVVIWSSADREVALKMAFMYVTNSKRLSWWEDITLVVWGPSAKLLSEDKELQDRIRNMISLGITVKACKSCSDSYGVSRQLSDLGITVKLMSELTEYLKEGRKVLTF